MMCFLFIISLVNILSKDLIQIYMKDIATVNNENNIMLGELTNIICDGICNKINFLKVSSSNGYITRFDLEKTLKNLGKNYKIYGKVTKIKQSKDLMLIDNLTKAVVSYVKKENGNKNLKVMVKIMNLEKENFKKLDNSIDDYQLETNAMCNISGTYFFNIKNSKNKFFEAKVDIYSDVLLAKTNVQINEDFNTSSFKKIRTKIILPNLVNSYDEISNFRSACNVRKGEILKSECISKRPFVLKDEIVKLEINSGNIKLSTNAKACSDANYNEIVEVVNLFSNEKIKARVTKGNTVEVKI